jgi:hypothetical protein
MRKRASVASRSDCERPVSAEPAVESDRDAWDDMAPGYDGTEP